MKIVDKIKIIIESLLIIILSGSICYICVNYTLDLRSQRNLNNLRDSVKASRLQFEEFEKAEISDNSTANNDSIGKNDKLTLVTTKDEKRNTTSSIAKEPLLDIYQELYEKNNNYTGWLYVEDTDIEYPVMKGPDNKFYLSHNIDKSYDKYGMLIMDTYCDYDYICPQLIIYGHNVNNGDLFGDLLFYKDKGYINYHPTICFDTIYDHNEYKVFAVLITSVTAAQNEIGLFTKWNFDNEQSYDDFIKWTKDNSLYDIDFTPSYDDEILTLVTCEHSNDEGRFVVLAAKIRE